MLIAFKVSNYRSISKEQVISLVPATKQKDYPMNIISVGKSESLNAIALYGANASGKSNLLKAISLLEKLLYLSPLANSTTKLPYSPFLLEEGYENLPTKLEIVFIANENRYRYIVEYNRNAIVAEYLYRKKIGREVPLFARQNDVIQVSEGFEGATKLIEAAIEATRDNALFLSICDMLNVKEAKNIFQWFNKCVFIDGVNTDKEEFETVKTWDEEPEYREKIKAYLALLNLGFVDLGIKIKPFEESDLPNNLEENIKNKLLSKLTGSKSYQPIATHFVYDKNGNKTTKTVSWDMKEESQGTQKAFHLSSPILKTLILGGVLIIDEIEAKMHPMMTINTINLFLNKETNPNQAQIIFATHDTNLLTYANLRRDQINFVEKNNCEATEIYSLSDFKYFNEIEQKEYSERIDVDKEKRYLEGRYGAIPVLGSFTAKMDKWYGKKR
jgi:AAA15 family ATPase/GTPase